MAVYVGERCLPGATAVHMLAEAVAVVDQGYARAAVTVERMAEAVHMPGHSAADGAC
jgi:hypothetical protein